MHLAVSMYDNRIILFIYAYFHLILTPAIPLATENNGRNGNCKHSIASETL